MKAIEAKAEKLLENCTEFTVASVSEEGFPRICIVSRLQSEGYGTILFCTGTNSVKTKHFLQNPKASACYYDTDNSVTLMGNVHVVTDEKVKSDIWTDGLYHHFPGGVNDPNYCVLRFDAVRATLWIDNEFVTLNC